jgi:hypothetical protein
MSRDSKNRENVLAALEVVGSQGATTKEIVQMTGINSGSVSGLTSKLSGLGEIYILNPGNGERRYVLPPYGGQRVPTRAHAKPLSKAIMVSFPVNGRAITMTLSDARSLYDDLRRLFGEGK